MTKDIALRESASRGSGATRTPIGARALAEAGKVNSRECGASLAVSILETTKASVSGAKGRDLTRVMSAVVAEDPVVGTSIMVGNYKCVA